MITTIGNTTYYSTTAEWKAAGMPGSDGIHTYVIGNPPPAGQPPVSVTNPPNNSGLTPDQIAAIQAGTTGNYQPTTPSPEAQAAQSKRAEDLRQKITSTPAPPPTSQNKTTSSDFETEDFNKRVDQFNTDADNYQRNVDAFNTKWASYISGQYFNGSEEQYQAYRKEANKLDIELGSLRRNETEIKIKEQRLVEKGKFLNEVDTKKQDNAIDKLSGYGSKDEGYDLGKAIADGVSVSTLKDAHFTDSQIEKAVNDAEYFKADGPGKFKILQRDGEIPKDATYQGIVADGVISFTTPQPLDKVEYAKMLIHDTNRRNLSTDTTTAGKGIGTLEDFKRNNPAEYKQAEAEIQQAAAEYNKETGLSLIPIYGPARSISKWDKDTATGWKVFDVATLALDVISAASLVKSVGGSTIRTIENVGKSAKVSKLIEVSGSEALGQIAKSDPKLARALTRVSDTGVKYAELTEEIAKLEKNMKYFNRGEVRTEAERTLELMKAKLPKAEEDLIKASRKYAEVAKSEIRSGLTRSELGPTGRASKGVPAAATTRDIQSLQDLDDLAKNLPRDIRETVNRRVNPRSVKVIQEELDDAEAALRKSRALGTTEPSKLYDLTGNVRKLKSELTIAQVGDIQKLESEWRVLKNETIPNLEKLAKEAKQNQSLISDDLERAVKQAKLNELKTQEQLRDAYRYLEEEWPAEPIPRGGKGGTMVKPRNPKTKYPMGSVGGARVKTQGGIKYLNARLMGYDSEGNPIYEIPPVQRIEVPGKETIKVEPQPWWQGEVETAPAPERTKPRTWPLTEPYIVTEPETEPAKRPPFEPEPGRITWTPGIAPNPRPKGAPVVVTIPDEGTGTGSEAETSSRTSDMYKTLVRAGMTPKQAQRMMEDIKIITSVRSSQKSTTKTSEQIKEKTAIRESTKEKTKEQVKQEQDTKLKDLTKFKKYNIRITKRNGKEPPVTIESVKGVPDNAGPVSWRQGRYWITASPPFSKGTASITYSRNIPPGAEKTMRTPQETLFHEKKPPAELVLGMGVTKATVTRGHKIDFTRQSTGKPMGAGVVRKGRRQHIGL